MAIFSPSGQDPYALSLPDILSATLLPVGLQMSQGFGPYGPGRVGGPLGVGLGALGGLMALYAQRQNQRAQMGQATKALASMGPEYSKYAPLLAGGGTIGDVLEAYRLKHPQAKPDYKSIELKGPHGGKAYGYQDLGTGTTQWLPQGEAPYSPEKQQQPKFTMKTLYGPHGRTREVPIPYGQPYTPPPGESLAAPQKPPQFNINMPLSPSDLVAGPGGKKGFLNRAGEFTPVADVTPLARPKEPTPPKVYTAADALKASGEALTMAQKELGKQGWTESTAGYQQRLQKATANILAKRGLLPSGYPIAKGKGPAPGTKVTIDDDESSLPKTLGSMSIGG